MASKPISIAAANYGAIESPNSTGSSSKQTRVAQAAFASRDVEASRQEHCKPRSTEEHKGGASEYVKSIVFGGLDGILTTFAIVTAAAGAGEDWRIILIFGLSNALADAWSMGFGEAISGMAELDFAASERERELWEVENNIEGEIEEMEEIYEQKGYSAEDAKTLVSIFSKDKDRFVDIMMVDELGLLVDLDDRYAPMKQGLVMFISFLTFGLFPIVPYFAGHGRGTDNVFIFACAVTAIGLMTLGGVKGHLTSMSIPKTAVQMLLQGSISGGVSYAVGVLVTGWIVANMGAAATKVAL